MVTKADNTGSLMSFELPNGKFKKRIWFRYGPGDYYVSMANQYNLLKGKLTYQFKVKNTRKDGDIYLLPSDRTQSDDPLIMNLAQKIIKGIDKDDKIAQIKAIHDYMVKTLTYGGLPDNDVNCMPSALTTLKNKGAACEGYTALFNALVRSIGIRAKQLEYEPGDDKPGHSWSQVYYNGKWYLVDVTWDDPDSNPDPNQISHEYFMLEDLDGINGDHSGWKDITESW
jgi:transglutaminase/protease-like cytokinesis protein 3